MDEAARCDDLAADPRRRIVAAGDRANCSRRTGANDLEQAFLTLVGEHTVSLRVTRATALRVLMQLRRDPRTLALVLLVPPLLLTIFRYVFDAHPGHSTA